MSMDAVSLTALLPTLIAVVLLTAITTGALAAAGIAHPGSAVSAIGRGVLQLAAISVILSGVISSPVLIALILVVMFAVAVTVASRRAFARGHRGHGVIVCGSAMFAGIVTATTVVFATGALDLAPRYALAIGAIVIGNTMSIATLTGRGFVHAVNERWDQVEGWLALGATPRRATADIGRFAVREALIPSLDQTRTTGLVVLPGAFVGAIFGGISPVDAGRFQIVVLASILCAGTITSLLIWLWEGDVKQRPSLVAT
ncbi:ABC transporter permease [Microbacterium nymphoidis]|uniref:ABC transporter permease n=1 Tax=Microbacterium nymphoidis TaxID=2898586 RepID=UPI001E4ECB4E|nr:ABC transporter permease [Microbacterium nymphoidis]MCD2496902.1 ABC transporter permease [Microbacterium nymphoidis]